MPGLIGMILTMTMVMMTAIAMTRERERGTMENLLAMPVRPFEVMLGKIVPYVVVGYIQVAVILLAAQAPVRRADARLALAAARSRWSLFIAANLAVGFTFSTIAKNQLQAMQMTFFFFLPSILLSGFMFPFRGMPDWAQVLGEVLPADAFPAHRARHPAQGQRLERDRAGDLADRAVHAGRGRDRAEPLPRDPRLSRSRGRRDRPEAGSRSHSAASADQLLDHRMADPPGGLEGGQEGGKSPFVSPARLSAAVAP